MSDSDHPDPGPEGGDAPSRSRRKREAEALQRRGEMLIELSEELLSQLPMPEPLARAVAEARRLNKRGALRRQRQYIGRLMRELDTGELEAAMDRLAQAQGRQRRFHHEVEAWRDRLLAEGETALEGLFDRYPGADRQRLRHLVQAARREAAAGGPPRRARELFRALRELLEAPEAR